MMLNEHGNKRVIGIFFFLLLLFALSSLGNAQNLLYAVTGESGGSGSPSVAFTSTSHEGIIPGSSVGVSLPDGSVVSGSVVAEQEATDYPHLLGLQTTGSKIIDLGQSGTLELHLSDTTIAGMTIFDVLGETVHSSIITSSGTGTLREEDVNEYFCAHFPQAPEQINFSALPEEIPSLNQVQNLESRPGATNVVHIDYWGGTLSGEFWFSQGTINYDPYDIDGDTSSFSDQELYHMYQAWAEAAEDYAPFDVNVTTKTSLFTSTPQANKSRIIATTNSTRNTYNLCSGCGGVAWVGQFGFNQVFQTGWTFNSGLSSMGMTHSHEAGHQMGLGHDGGSFNPNYYSGHGLWGPIMGAPFGKNYVQWSKGDYPSANNQQDDFSVINNKLGTVPDQEGATYATAEVLGNAVDIIREFVPGGAVGSPSANGDVDYYKFVVPQGGAIVELTVAPELGLDTTQNAGGETFGANVTMQGGLFKHPHRDNGYLVRVREDDNFPVQPNTNRLHYSGFLTGGNYAFWVEPRSPDYNWSTGFDDWGNGGKYRVQLDAQASPEPLMVSPQPLSTIDQTELFQWNDNGVNATNYQLYIGSNVGGRQHFNSGDIGTATSQLAVDIPTNDLFLHVRLWYSVDNTVTWDFVDWRYRARHNPADPDWISPVAGTALGNASTGEWEPGTTAMDRYRVYAGPSVGSSDWTFTSNLPASTRSHPIDGWTISDHGKIVWVRFLWRNASTRVWKRSNHSYVAGFGPAVIDSEIQRPVPVGQ